MYSSCIVLNHCLLSLIIYYEIEIRGCSIEAVNRIVTRTQKLIEAQKSNISQHLNCIIVDYFLWGFRREKADEMTQFPYHKVRSIYY